MSDADQRVLSDADVDLNIDLRVPERRQAPWGAEQRGCRLAKRRRVPMDGLPRGTPTVYMKRSTYSFYMKRFW